ncbi:MAG: hypothetical protein QXQ91_05140, partial [Nanopusillaceae archaeon]
ETAVYVPTTRAQVFQYREILTRLDELIRFAISYAPAHMSIWLLRLARALLKQNPEGDTFRKVVTWLFGLEAPPEAEVKHYTQLKRLLESYIDSAIRTAAFHIKHATRGGIETVREAEVTVVRKDGEDTKQEAVPLARDLRAYLKDVELGRFTGTALEYTVSDYVARLLEEVDVLDHLDLPKTTYDVVKDLVYRERDKARIKTMLNDLYERGYAIDPTRNMLSSQSIFDKVRDFYHRVTTALQPWSKVRRWIVEPVLRSYREKVILPSAQASQQ